MFRSYDHPQGTYCSLLKLYIKTISDVLHYLISVTWQHALIYNFSEEQYVLPGDDLMIETFRSVLSVLM